MSQIEQVLEWAREIIHNEGFEWVDAIVRGTKNSPVFQFLVDTENGVTIKECSNLSRMISDIIEVRSEDIGLTNFSLEVSSPGIDRSLKTEFDFNKNKGRDVAVTYSSNGQEQKVNGYIIETTSDSVSIQTNTAIHHIPFDSILSAKIQVKWQ